MAMVRFLGLLLGTDQLICHLCVDTRVCHQDKVFSLGVCANHWQQFRYTVHV